MWRHGFLAFATVVVAFGAAPVTATIYTGTLNGLVTSGAATFFDELNEESGIFNLTGDALVITFTADVRSNYIDPVFGQFYPKYVINTVEVRIPALGTMRGLGTVSSSQTNDINMSSGAAGYAGDARSGMFVASGSLFFPYEPDFEQSAIFSFANASSALGPVTGAGTATSGFYDGISYMADYSVSFDLFSGFVTGIPEPRAWTLMIIGFGGVGGMLRRAASAVVQV